MLIALAKTTGDVHVGKGGFAAGSRIAVSYPHRGGFLQSGDVFQFRKVLQRVHQRSLASARVPEHVLDTFGHKHLCQGLFAGHSGHASLQLNAVATTC